MKIVVAALTAMILTSWTLQASVVTSSKDYKEAVRLYESGMYERALGIFNSISGDDPMAKGYAVLCMAQMKSPGYEEALGYFLDRYGVTSLDSQIHLIYAENLFDEQRYADALPEFEKVNVKDLTKSKHTEVLYKQGYCDFGRARYPESEDKFNQVVKRAASDYTAPATYALGYIAYDRRDFADAYSRFESSAKDPRFEQQSNYYMLECRFMQKDYQYVIDNGETIYQQVPEERKPHLSRIISESYLVMGDAESAKDYYDRAAEVKPEMNRADYFYAGSLQYALQDWQSAIDNYTKMGALNDSIGQIAAYQLGYSYIKTKNKVSAMDSFGIAVSDYDQKIKEDAMFNYAKLAFDLNHDPSGFKSYLNQYRNSGKNDMINDYIAVASLFNHDYVGAIEAYDNIEELTPAMKSNYMKANYLRAEQLISSGSYRDAVASLRAATFFTSRQDNFNKLSRYWLAESYYKTEDYAAAENIYTDLYNLSALEGKTEGRLLPYNVAYCFFNQENYEAAATWFDKYVAGSDKSVRQDAMTRRADCDFLRKDYKAAIASYAGVISEYPEADNVYPYYQQGLAYGLAGKKNDKVAALSKVRQASPDAPFYAEAMYELGRAYISVNKESDAVKCFENIVEESDNSTYVAKSLIELGMICRNKSQYNKALEYYKQVAEDYKGSESAENALLAIEAIYQTKGEPDKYLEYTEALGQPKKSDAEKELVYFNSAQQVYMSGDYEKAVVALEKYLAAYPEGSKVGDANFFMADSYKNLGRKEKACDYFEKVMNSTSDGSFKELACLNYASLSFGMEHFKEAYGAYAGLLEVAQLDDNKMTAKTGMMRSAFRGRDFDNAIQAASILKADAATSAELAREADYTKAKSYLATSRREEAYTIFKSLAKTPSTNEGAEAAYLMIQDSFDKGNFRDVEDAVYKFADAAPSQSYWLAKAFIVLGDTFAENDNIKQAQVTFESILNGYEPANGISDDVTDNVKMRLEKINQLQNK